MGERNLIIYVLLLISLSFLFLFSSHFYSWIMDKNKDFLDLTLKILSRNILYVIGLLIGLLMPLSFLKKFRFFISWGLLILLAVPIILNITIKNTHRWIPVGGFTIQPSEIFKIGFILQLSNFMADYKNRLKIIGFSIYVILAIILLYKIPHFSAIIGMFFVGFVIMFLKGIRIHYIMTSAIPLVLIFLSLFYIKKNYVIERLERFKNRETHYQVKQAKIAISRGGIFGVGIGKGKIKYKFLPDLSKDFIFSLIAEETGLFGVTILLLIYLFIIKSLFDGALLIEDDFYKIFILGVALYTFFNVFVHISVNMGIIPVTGVPLPLISYGGTSGLTYSFLFGVSYKLMKEREKLKKEEIKILWPRFS